MTGYESGLSGDEVMELLAQAASDYEADVNNDFNNDFAI